MTGRFKRPMILSLLALEQLQNRHADILKRRLFSPFVTSGQNKIEKQNDSVGSF